MNGGQGSLESGDARAAHRAKIAQSSSSVIGESGGSTWQIRKAGEPRASFATGRGASWEILSLGSFVPCITPRADQIRESSAEAGYASSISAATTSAASR